MNYIKSPINYTGSKYKLLNEIMPLFPININTFLDVFGGSGVVSLNIDANVKIYNELNKHLYGIVNELKNNDSDFVINHIKNRVKEFDLKKGYKGKDISDEEIKENEKIKENYLCFRKYLNEESITKSLDLFTIHYYSFNNLIRYNNSTPSKFNVPSGARAFSDKVHIPLIENACSTFKNIDISNLDFRKLDYSNLNSYDFVYFDPPYLLSNAEYNKIWSEKEELDLYNICEELDKKGVKWAISNMLINNEKEHTMLKEWCEKNNYKINLINSNYSGWTSKKTYTYSKTQEILITNY